MGIWASGHLGMWSFGHLDIGAFGSTGNLKLDGEGGPLDPWPFRIGYLEAKEILN